MTASEPKRVDPPSCGCTDCLTGYSVPLNLATWQTVKAMIHGDVQDATGTELDVMVVVSPTAERGQDDKQAWAWKYDLASIVANADRRRFLRKVARISADHPMPAGAPVAECGHCGTRITLVAGDWIADDGTVACTDTAAPFVPHNPKEN